MRKKLIYRFILIFLLPTLFIVACQEQKKEKSTAGGPEKGIRGKILVSGSGTLIPLFEKFKEAFEKERPEYFVKILPGTNTAGGIKGVKEKIIDVGLCSRALTPEEQKLGLKHSLLAKDEIIFAVNNGVSGLQELTPEQLRSIYHGQIKNWKQLGANDLHIVALDRDENEAIKMTLRKELLGQELKIDREAIILMHSADMDKGIVSVAGAIGYTGKGESKVQRLALRPITIKGCAAGPEAVKSGECKLFIEIGVCVSPDMNDKTRAFFEFITGPKGKAIMEQYEYVTMGKNYGKQT